MSAASWRDPQAYEHLAEASPSALAWEFLRRNPSYRLEAGDPSVWGLSAYADPNLSAAEQRIWWRPDIHPRIVLVAPAAPGSNTLGVSPAFWMGVAQVLETASGVQVLLRIGAEEHRLFAEGCSSAEALAKADGMAVHHPMDDDFELRSEAALALYRALRSSPAKRTSDAPKPRPDNFLRRAILMLRALDGRAEGASQRVLAEHLLRTKVSSPREWEDSADRATISRLLRKAAQLVAGGYRALLRR